MKIEDNLRNILEESLPARARRSGLTLYNILKEQIAWNELGQIIIDDEIVKGSNIVDLIADLSRDWKKRAVTGWPTIKQELQTINFPRSLILNTRRLADLDDIPKTPRPDSSPSGMSYASDKFKRVVKGRIRKKPYASLKWINS